MQLPNFSALPHSLAIACLGPSLRLLIYSLPHHFQSGRCTFTWHDLYPNTESNKIPPFCHLTPAICNMPSAIPCLAPKHLQSRLFLGRSSTLTLVSYRVYRAIISISIPFPFPNSFLFSASPLFGLTGPIKKVTNYNKLRNTTKALPYQILHD